MKKCLVFVKNLEIGGFGKMLGIYGFSWVNWRSEWKFHIVVANMATSWCMRIWKPYLNLLLNAYSYEGKKWHIVEFHEIWELWFWKLMFKTLHIVLKWLKCWELYKMRKCCYVLIDLIEHVVIIVSLLRYLKMEKMLRGIGSYCFMYSFNRS